MGPAKQYYDGWKQMQWRVPLCKHTVKRKDAYYNKDQDVTDGYRNRDRDVTEWNEGSDIKREPK